MNQTGLNTRVLVLNRSYLPVHITSAKRAFTLLYQGTAKALNQEYELLDFKAWCSSGISAHEPSVRSVNRMIRVPRIILLVAYDRIPKRQLRFSRLNIYARDQNTCQYCGNRFPRNQLNLDHVIPRAQGGKSVWENVVCSCISCNHQKGGRTPEQANMRLVHRPKRPVMPALNLGDFTQEKCGEWHAFIHLIDSTRA